MNRVAALLAGLLLLAGLAAAEPVTTIRNNGSSDNRVDLVVLGDGYTAAQIASGKYASDVQNAVNGFFLQQPFLEYQNFFNVHRIDVTSAESGADHDTPSIIRVNTALDAAYDCAGIQRLICVNTSKVNTILVNSIPSPDARDIILVLVNDPVYGGSGGTVAVASIHSLAIEIVLHEVGHSFGLLADEYGGPPPPSCVNTIEPSAANATMQTVRSQIKWNAWIDAGTPIPTTTTATGVPGLYQGAQYCDTGLYRPTYNSKMRSLNVPFEQINSEQMIKRTYNYVSPIDAVSPANTAVTIPGTSSQLFTVSIPQPVGHALTVSWLLDGVAIGSGSSVTLNGAGAHRLRTLEVRVSDVSPMVRNDPSGLLNDSHTWSVTVGGGVSSDVDGNGSNDLLWRNSTSGANAVWYLSGTTLLSQGNLPEVTDLAWQMIAIADLNLDGHPDIIWRHRTSGDNAVWYLNGTSVIGTASLPAVPDLRWQLVGSADFNQDGAPDLVWRDLVSGTNVVWYLNGVTLLGAGNLPAVPDLAWQMVASADLNQDGRPDLLWRHAATGANVIWYLNDTSFLGQGMLPDVPDPAWRLMAAIDLTGNDGQPELVWRHSRSGANAVWTFSGTTITGQASLPTVADPTWRMMGALPPEIPHDVNRDRHPDLVWRNTASGANIIWLLSGTSLVSQASLPAVPDPHWKRVATADLNGDTYPDLIWRNQSTGDDVVWYMAATTFVSQGTLPSVPDVNWHIVAAADINKDTYPDLVWRNASTGANIVWYLQGTTLIGQGGLPAVPDLSWTVAGAADVNGDTYPDLVWRNASTGANVVWYLQGTAFLSQGTLTTVPDVAWRIGLIADVNGDGHPDLVWRHASTGDNVVWYLSGTTFLGQGVLTAVADTNWTLRQ